MTDHTPTSKEVDQLIEDLVHADSFESRWHLAQALREALNKPTPWQLQVYSNDDYW